MGQYLVAWPEHQPEEYHSKLSVFALILDYVGKWHVLSLRFKSSEPEF